jgi:hypothetical protein
MKILNVYVCSVFFLPVLIGCDGKSSTESPPSGDPETPDFDRSNSGPVENIEASERMEAAALVEATSPFQQELKRFNAEIRGAFDEKRFDFLEEKAKEFRESEELFPDGTWKLTRFYEAVGNRFHSGDAGYLTDLATFESWEQSHPDSTTRRVALMDFLISYAWHARGSGYARTVTDEQWQLMGDRLAHAWKISQTLRQAEEKDPYGFEMAIVAAMGLGLKAPEFESILSEYRSHFPSYYPVEVRRAYSLLPRWHGKEGDWEAFAVDVSKLEGGLGDEAYIRILMNLKRFYADIFRDSAAVWPEAKRGLEILNRKYPDSLEIQNFTAYFAVLGRDREMAREYFDKLGDAYVPEVWSKPERFVHFRTWARTGEW